jgi:uncharacterized protein (TIGR00661 family)
MKILYALCTWGLGHFTRSLPVIRRLIEEGHEIYIYTTHRPLLAAKKELKDTCHYIDGYDYPSPYTNKGEFVLKLIFKMGSLIKTMIREHDEIEDIINKEKIDMIISDGKYGAFNKKIPSFFIFHQLRYIPPSYFKFMNNQTERWNKFFEDSFEKFIVPDFEGEYNLTGDLSHNLLYIHESKVEYVGILSDYKNLNLRRDIDYLIVISGREPNRTLLEEKLKAQLKYLKGKIVFVKGKPEESKHYTENGVEFISYAGAGIRDELMNRAKFVVARAGYSTIMDIVELNKKALLIPTPGQTEQEYLAKYLDEKKYFCGRAETKVDLKYDIPLSETYSSFQKPWGTEKTVENILNIIKRYA